MFVLNQQQKLHREMAAAVRDLKTAGTITAASVLALISFMYGVLHAAGPGHGKAVISSYVLANERTVRRGVFLSFLAALIQAISAIAVVGILAIALNATSLSIKSTEGWIETLSWALVAAIGAWMLTGQVKRLLAYMAEKPSEHDHTHHCHDHGHSHGACCADYGAAAHAHPGHDHDGRAHSHDACCGHAHMPVPKELEGELSWRKALAIAFSVGIRPCSGAIIVMIFALSQGLLWAGIFATFAMALGTAITVSALAALAVGSKELAQRMAGEESPWAQRIGLTAGLTGSALVMLMGTVFFFASLQGPALV
jgi:ABC-type nickel/cobalt efflux system permease component RcnA